MLWLSVFWYQWEDCLVWNSSIVWGFRWICCWRSVIIIPMFFHSDWQSFIIIPMTYYGLSITCQAIALGYAIMTTKASDLDWKIRALRVLPVFLLPALASITYFTLRSFTRMCKHFTALCSPGIFLFVCVCLRVCVLVFSAFVLCLLEVNGSVPFQISVNVSYMLILQWRYWHDLLGTCDNSLANCNSWVKDLPLYDC